MILLFWIIKIEKPILFFNERSFIKSYGTARYLVLQDVFLNAGILNNETIMGEEREMIALHLLSSIESMGRVIGHLL